MSNISITLSPLTIEEYKNQQASCINYLFNKDMLHMLKLGFFKDNRKRFEKLFGKPHFYYLNSSRRKFSCWRVQFKCEVHCNDFYILTAKEIGTSIESSSTNQTIIDHFVNWYEKQLEQNP